MSQGSTTPQAEFGALFNELLATRARYESLRMAGASYSDRADMIDRLHSLRHNMSLLRRNLI
jgi:hypothetical protein